MGDDHFEDEEEEEEEQSFEHLGAKDGKDDKGVVEQLRGHWCCCKKHAKDCDWDQHEGRMRDKWWGSTIRSAPSHCAKKAHPKDPDDHFEDEEEEEEEQSFEHLGAKDGKDDKGVVEQLRGHWCCCKKHAKDCDWDQHEGRMCDKWWGSTIRSAP